MIALIEWKYFILTPYSSLRFFLWGKHTNVALTHPLCNGLRRMEWAKESAWLARFFYAQECIQHKNADCLLHHKTIRTHTKRCGKIGIMMGINRRPHELAMNSQQLQNFIAIATRRDCIGPYKRSHIEITINWPFGYFVEKFIADIPCASEMFAVEGGKKCFHCYALRGFFVSFNLAFLSRKIEKERWCVDCLAIGNGFEALWAHKMKSNQLISEKMLQITTLNGISNSISIFFFHLTIDQYIFRAVHFRLFKFCMELSKWTSKDIIGAEVHCFHLSGERKENHKKVEMAS